ncbi:DNA primase [Propionibacterium australiense]|uniref:DNA primase n=1 Tax=Propionibacterium australiense TaxID=119981 RepID=A0A383S4C6_9ACTN|nr:DNA primase [Propionibacterium australiense]RLP11440.1 DNA primase [Propionibacterium australiense]RLP12824.1 DNA primase [Propionibacterium australiense]SYZ32136.1 DnaB-helicase binding domain of primase [Propionibacterium australiense]VEH90826.1 DNA primase [Propionibacterium australiense]
MAGRINDEDIALVRERARIDDVVGSYVTLRNAGGGSLKGLCPFHDEKTPSFQVTPARGLFYCFGCGEGGDVITFMQKIDNLSFTEAVQALADRTGVQLRIVDDGRPSTPPGQRVRIMEANQLAADFYAAQLAGPEAIEARRMLDGRGFDRAAAEKFGVGYAPKDGRALHRHLAKAGFGDDELVRAGLIRERGGWDYFQGRVIWPIKDSGRSVLGFGARRLYDDDRLPAKYINTPETPVYKKSHVLYGLDLARQNIGKKQQAVVMEGYTDVMSAHLAGVDTAVAVCGTAFGEDHARLLQRLMGSSDVTRGEIVFTFDGDRAGQAAALKVYKLDRSFTSQTYVAVEPSGLDPCDLRMAQGDAAVRELIGRREPLYLYVMAHTIAGYDLDRADGRVEAVRAASGMIASVRDSSLVNEYVRELARLVGMDPGEVRRIISDERRRRPRRPEPERAPDRIVEPGPGPTRQQVGLPWPDPRDHRLDVERGTLKLMLQRPTLFDTAWNGVGADDFTHPALRAVFEAIAETGYQPQGWVEQVQSATADPTARQLEVALLVEPLLSEEPTERYAAAYTSKLRMLTVMRRIDDLKSRLQRTNPVTDQAEHADMFTTLLALEVERKRLAQDSIGFLE